MRMLETSRITFCLEASNETLVLETCRLCLEIYSLVRNGVTFGSLARNVRVEDFLLHFLEESQAKRLILRLRTSLWRKSRTRVSSNNVTQEPATILTQERYMRVSQKECHASVSQSPSVADGTSPIKEPPGNLEEC